MQSFECWNRMAKIQGWHYFVMEHLSGGDLRQAVLAKRVTAAQAMQSIRPRQ